jgi:[ribosomal protein S5]-alanine N-acetyltransferase
MDIESLPTLTTPRLVLRPYEPEDWRATLERSLDREFGRFLPLPQPYEERHAYEFIASVLLRSPETHPSFAVTSGGRLVGDVNLRIDPAHRTASVGYGFARPEWGKGFTTEAVHAVFAWAFASHGLVRIEATADAENIGSWRVMEKLGMRREGYFRKYRTLRGEHRDVVLYAILREEFSAPAS